jgi:hypothetical protein
VPRRPRDHRVHPRACRGPSSSAPSRDFSRRGALRGRGERDDALELMLRAVGNTGPATRSSCPPTPSSPRRSRWRARGARPVLVDVDARYQLMDVEQAARQDSRAATRALLPVHLCSARSRRWRRSATLAKDRNLLLLEDAAQSQGARRNGTAPGGFGLAAATSFYPGKNLGAYGDGGRRPHQQLRSSAKVRALRNYGSEVKYRAPGARLQLAPRHAPGGGALGQAAPPGRLERGAPPGRRRYDELLAGLPRHAARARCPATSTSGTSTSSACRARRGAAKLNAAAWAPASTTPSPSTSRAPSAASATSRATSPSPRRPAARSSRCRSPADHRRAAGARGGRAAEERS